VPGATFPGTGFFFAFRQGPSPKSKASHKRLRKEQEKEQAGLKFKIGFDLQLGYGFGGMICQGKDSGKFSFGLFSEVLLRVNRSLFIQK
jgi:hypothetical protein